MILCCNAVASTCISSMVQSDISVIMPYNFASMLTHIFVLDYCFLIVCCCEWFPDLAVDPFILSLIATR